MSGTYHIIDVRPVIPARLHRLPELAGNLLYSWNHQIRSLFIRLDKRLWRTCGHSPKLLLQRISQARLDEVASDPVYLEEYQHALSVFDSYRADRRHRTPSWLNPADGIAYFCAEFGLHESLPIYSGGLGILAGDHCKAASDLGLPFTAVGLLYRQGYFSQTIDQHGNQVVRDTRSDFDDLPISAARDADGNPLFVSMRMQERNLRLKVWLAEVGNIRLYLLDSDIEDNEPTDRTITHQLYGGDRHTRIQQEMVLGIGGVRALRAAGIAPVAWHINEGHSAFQLLERTRELVQGGMDFDGAFELTAAGTVFTTHTPVAAGHDIFDHALLEAYLGSYIAELGIPLARFAGLGNSPANPGGFNMTALALRGSRQQNGVSRIHGAVASAMEGYVWPEIPPDENPLRYVTNGVHVPTFLAREWSELLDMRLGSGWRNELVNEAYWTRIDAIPDHSYWSLRRGLKAEMLVAVRARLAHQYRRYGVTESAITRACRYLNDEQCNPLVLGFARRFATYKRATLIFSDPARLARLLSDPARPTVLLFAGKAHPHDLPGQEFLRAIHAFSQQPEFEGRVILLEDYDLSLARKLVSGVDVWLNTPQYPLEASGTSGQKAALNGVLNLSVLDGWWGEGFHGDNGWAIAPCTSPDAAERDRTEAQELLDIFEREIQPLYFARDGQGHSPGWIRLSKNAMKRAIPAFNAERMVLEYLEDFYRPAMQLARTLGAEHGMRARLLGDWKQRVTAAWPHVRGRVVGDTPRITTAGQPLKMNVVLDLNRLAPEDVVVECVIYSGDDATCDKIPHQTLVLTPEMGEGQGHLYGLVFTPDFSGRHYYRLRMYPYHPDLAHPFELGLMTWL